MRRLLVKFARAARLISGVDLVGPDVQEHHRWRSGRRRLVVTVARVQALLDEFVAEDVVDVVADTVGVSNVTYFVGCASGRRYAVRLLREQTVESVRAEARIQRLLVRSGIGSPLYLARRDGEVVGRLDGSTCTVAAAIVGEHPSADTLALTADIGRTLARIHDVVPQAEVEIGVNSGQWLDPRNAHADAEASPPDVRAALERALAAWSDVFDVGLPLAVVHGELGTNNLFASEDEVGAVFDWETAQHGPRVLDLAFSWLSAVYDGALEPASAKDALLGGYDEAAALRLTAAEHRAWAAAVRYVSGATAAWYHRHGHDAYGARFLAAGAALHL